MTDRSVLIEKADAAYRLAYAESAIEGPGRYAAHLKGVEAAINAIAPGLLLGTAWVAPNEPSKVMVKAGEYAVLGFNPDYESEGDAADRIWRAMRDAS